MISRRSFETAAQLKRVNIDTLDLDSSESRFSLVEAADLLAETLSEIPRLTSFTWIDFYAGVALSVIDYMSFDSLTELTLVVDETYLSFGVDVIRECTALVFLRLARTDGTSADLDDDEEPNRSQFHLSHLRFLELELQPSDCADFMQMLVCPNLISLTVTLAEREYFPDEIRGFSEKLSNFLVGMSSLQELVLEHIVPSEIVPFFEGEKFQLENIPVVDVYVHPGKSNGRTMTVQEVLGIVCRDGIENRKGWTVKKRGATRRRVITRSDPTAKAAVESARKQLEFS
jgi:hypothetical protein